MSILKKNALAIALVAGLGLAGSAGAYTLTTNANTAPVFVATFDIAGNATPIGVNETFEINLTGGDFILGRTTGFTVRYSLSNGATFGDAVTTADITNVGPNSSWLISVIAGGAVGDNFIVIKLDPAAVPVGLVPGTLLNVTAATAVVAPTPGTGQILSNLAALQTAGQQVVANLLFVDPVTSAQILPSGSLALLQSGDPVVQACDASLGDVAKTIDVGTDGTHAPKTFFSSTGEIGLDDSGFINLGQVSAAVNPSFPSFVYQPTDAFVTTVTGDFSAFSVAGNSVFLSANNDCSTADAAGTINNGTGTVTFNYTLASIGGGGGGFQAYVCGAVAGGNTAVIDASAVSERTTFSRGSATSNGTSCDLLPLRYNGSVVEVYAINPAGVSTAQSFLRVINPSAGAGTVTIVGTDDAGNVSTPISFVLGAGESMQINSERLENGGPGLTGSWGDGTGKWRAVVTGEFAHMRVQSLNRNTTDGTVTNLTDADGKGEQLFNQLLDN